MSGIGISGWPTSGSVGTSRKGDREEQSGSSTFAQLLKALGGRGTASDEAATPLEEVPEVSDLAAELDPKLLVEYEQNLALLRDRLAEIADKLDLYSDGALEIQEGLSQNLVVSGADPERSELEAAINNDPAIRQLFQAVKSQAQQLDQSFGAANALAGSGLAPVEGALSKRFQLVIDQRQIRAELGLGLLAKAWLLLVG